jgi:predicted RNA polymerase sigma factor
VAGLLALMMLTKARLAARARPDGSLIPLAEQDHSRWNQELIADGVRLITDALSRTRPGPYQLQAAIAAVHDEAARVDDADWHQILALYAAPAKFMPGDVSQTGLPAPYKGQDRSSSSSNRIEHASSG